MKILITGGSGLVGASFKQIKTDHELILVSSSDYNLTVESEVINMFETYRPTGVIHLAAKVGGVKANTDQVADFFYQNILMNTHILHHAARIGVNKVVSLLSTCVYPDQGIIWPLTEDQIHLGPPHVSNFGYAYAKRMLDIQSQAYRQQYGCNFVTVVPNNLYGPNDNFDLENGHVIPAIIRKVWEAKMTNTVPKFWGDGSPMREFTFAPDLAHILLNIIENYNHHEPLNVGNDLNISIKFLVDKICEILEYSGEIEWDSSKPNGQLKKPSSLSKWLNLQHMGDMPEYNREYTHISSGLLQTCEWFKNNYPFIRGVKKAND